MRRVRAAAAAAAAAAIGFATLGPGAVAAPGDIQVSLVKDIVPGPGDSAPTQLTAVGSDLYFRADHPTYGVELFRKTPGGSAAIVKDLNPGAPGSIPDNLTAVGGRLFFTAQSGTGDRELYVSDGTRAGTLLVRNISSAASSSPTELTDVNGTLYFSADDSAGDRELWKSDGTKAGTVRVRNINARTDVPAEHRDSFPRELTDVGGTLFFHAVTYDPSGQVISLWKSDGTWGGTVPVKGRLDLQPESLTAVGGSLFFTALNAYGRELWRSDGTAVGTTIVKDILPGPGMSLPEELTAVGSTLFFSARDADEDRELWKSNGTRIGTQRVKNINVFPSPDPIQTSSTPRNLTDVDGTLYFTAVVTFQGELFKSDGTRFGTVMLPESLVDGSSVQLPTELEDVGDLLFYRGTSDASVDRLYYTDGTSVHPVGPVTSAGTQEPGELTNVDGILYWRDYTTANGLEVWKATIEP